MCATHHHHLWYQQLSRRRLHHEGHYFPGTVPRREAVLVLCGVRLAAPRWRNLSRHQWSTVQVTQLFPGECAASNWIRLHSKSTTICSGLWLWEMYRSSIVEKRRRRLPRANDGWWARDSTNSFWGETSRLRGSINTKIFQVCQES